MPAGNIQVRYALVCDDVRREENGKEMLIGLYNGAMSIAVLPQDIPVSMWLSVRYEGSGVVTKEMRVIARKGTVLAQTELPIPLQDNARPGSIVIKGIPLKLREPGSLIFQWRDFPAEADAQWHDLAELEIRHELAAKA